MMLLESPPSADADFTPVGKFCAKMITPEVWSEDGCQVCVSCVAGSTSFLHYAAAMLALWWGFSRIVMISAQLTYAGDSLHLGRLSDDRVCPLEPSERALRVSARNWSPAGHDKRAVGGRVGHTATLIPRCCFIVCDSSYLKTRVRAVSKEVGRRGGQQKPTTNMFEHKVTQKLRLAKIDSI